MERSIRSDWSRSICPDIIDSGIPRRRMFLGDRKGKEQRLYCLNGRPVASAVPINNSTWVSISSLRPHLGNVLRDDELKTAVELTNGVRKWYTMPQSKTKLQQALIDLKKRWEGPPGSVDINHPNNLGPLLEAEDPRGHRHHICFGLYHHRWFNEKPFSGVPFFDWIDFGSGRLANPIDHANVDPNTLRLATPDIPFRNWESKCTKDIFNGRRILYFMEEKSKKYAVDLKPYRDGRFIRMTFKESGRPVTSDDEDLLWVWGLDKTLYVIVGEHYIGHTSLLAAKPALAAGEMYTGANGRLAEVDFGSGHYQPNTENFVAFYNWMLDRGLNVSSVHWELRSKWNVTRASLRKALNTGKKISRTSFASAA